MDSKSNPQTPPWLPPVLASLQRTQQALAASLDEQRKISDLLLYQQTRELQQAHPNPLNRCGSKCFSQTDEDGITLEILRRLDLLQAPGRFAEFGVGNGLENNTLVLAALGWKGYWVGGDELAFRYRPGERLVFTREWITLDNILDLAERSRRALALDGLDVVSLDLDGNDIYLAGRLLEHGVRPALFIVEYNARFPPPVRFQIPYRADFKWQGDDFYGASLQSFDDLFTTHGYRLVACNSHTGANAFYVDARHAGCFADVPGDLRALYVEPRFHLYNTFGHGVSAALVERILGL